MRIRTAIALAASLLALVAPAPAGAGCGCDKPPPPVASVRPAFASPGAEVALFAPTLAEGSAYTVVFAGGDAAAAAVVEAVATSRRDFGDGVVKPQVVVRAPQLAPGPTSITVLDRKKEKVLRVPADDFTMLQRPLVLDESNGGTAARCYRAAVGRDGTVYVPLDVSAVAERMVFSGLGRDFPLLFDAGDVVIYNTQGVLMQLLGPESADIFAIVDPGAPDSFELVYDRHEFQTYRAAHAHEGGYGLDPRDPAWHADGSRHIDHDHLVLAIQGKVEGQGAPAPGVTPPFTLDVGTALAEGTHETAAVTTLQWSPECDRAAADLR